MNETQTSNIQESNIKAFNRAYRIAWELAAQHAAMKPGFGLKLQETLKKLAKHGGSPEDIGREAFEKVCPNLLPLSDVA